MDDSKRVIPKMKSFFFPATGGLHCQDSFPVQIISIILVQRASSSRISCKIVNVIKYVFDCLNCSSFPTDSTTEHRRLRISISSRQHDPSTIRKFTLSWSSHSCYSEFLQSYTNSNEPQRSIRFSDDTKSYR